jgi:pimeloyl-ACP methyl ester carboxylesterase
MKRAYVDVPTGQMHYRFAGSGETVILLHMSGSSSDEYEQVGNCLAPRYRVYAPDFPGFGCSDRPRGRYSLRMYAKSVISFMDSLALESAVIAGNLVGANIAAHVAALCPQRVRGLAFGGLCFHPDPHFFIGMRDSPVFSAVLPTEDGSHLREIWKRAAKYGASASVANQRAVCLHAAGEYGESLHWALCEDEGFASLLAGLRLPVLLLNYGQTPGAEASSSASEVIANVKTVSMPEATPYVTREQPQAFARRIAEFVAVLTNQ